LEFNMNSIKVAVAQFEPRDGDKPVNLVIMEDLIRRASNEGAEVISFHELCTTGYTFLQNLTRDEIDELAEEIPDGATTKHLMELARRYGVIIMAGILERENDHYYNSYVAVDGNGMIARHRKLHPFISKFLSAGDSYTIFDL